MKRLGVNIDHVATLARLRDTQYPDLLRATDEVVQGGAHQITVHLREDRRHIQDANVVAIMNHLTKNHPKVELNLEIALTAEMLQFAAQVKPHSVCLVPEKREERTTEGGLDLKGILNHSAKKLLLSQLTETLSKKEILVSFFIEPDAQDIKLSADFGAKAVEIHTGSLCLAFQQNNQVKLNSEFARLKTAVEETQRQKLLLHAGHGIDYDIAPLLTQKFPEIREYNIGHSIVCESVFIGLRAATRKMKDALWPS